MKDAGVPLARGPLLNDGLLQEQLDSLCRTIESGRRMTHTPEAKLAHKTPSGHEHGWSQENVDQPVVGDVPVDLARRLGWVHFLSSASFSVNGPTTFL